MKVECLKNVNPITGKEVGDDYWMTVGKVYTVLSVLAAPEDQVYLRLMSDNSVTPIVVDSRFFKTVCDTIPSGWVAVIDDQGTFRLGPKAWMRPGFWEDYFDGVQRAIEEFEMEKSKMMAE